MPGFAKHSLLVTGLVLTMVANGLVLSAAPASAKPAPKAVAVDTETLTPRQLREQIKAADALRAELMQSSAQVAAANGRLERFSAQANTLLAELSAARTAEADAQTAAVAQRRRLGDLGVEVEAAQDALGRLASDSYIRGGGPLGEIAALFNALTIASPDKATDSLATVHYLIDARARLFDRAQSLQSEQVVTSARADATNIQAVAAAKTATEAKSALYGVVAHQRDALGGFRVAQAGQVGQAARLRNLLLHSQDPAAREADRRLAEALQGPDYLHVRGDGSSCGRDVAIYPNGALPPSALCPLYAAPGQSLIRPAALAFNTMSQDYKRQTGAALCVSSSYRSYAEQVVVKRESKKMAASPGRSQHGLGLALDLCGGVQSFSAPAHLWMQRNAPLYGWFHPAWAQRSGSLPEPWHWQFAN